MYDQETPPSSLAGYLFAISATAIWSGNFIVARDLSESIPPVGLAFWRWVVAVLASVPFALKPCWNQRHLIRRHLRDLTVTAFLGITVFKILLYTAGHTTTALNLSLIAIIFPVFILLLIQGDFSALAGLSFSVGDLWRLAASFIFALYRILMKQKPAEMSIWTFRFTTFSLGLMFLVPFFWWEPEPVQSGPVGGK